MDPFVKGFLKEIEKISQTLTAPLNLAPPAQASLRTNVLGTPTGTKMNLSSPVASLPSMTQRRP